MKFVSLFTGIGGLDLGLERAGHECVLQVENDPYCQQVLAKHWPDVKRIADVREVKADDCEEAEAIVGGFPCQPVSVAGKRQAQADPRWLWPQFARLISGVRPRYVVVENVPGLLTSAMGEVLGDLSACGYDAQWGRIAAETVGAPHLRWRIFIVAYAGSERVRLEQGRSRGQSGEDSLLATGDGTDGFVAYTDAIGRDGWTGIVGPGRGAEPADGSLEMAYAHGARLQGRWSEHELQTASGEKDTSRSSSDARTVSNHWLVEPDVGRVAHGVPERVDRLRTLGNAVVPQVAEVIGRMLPV